MRIRNTTSSRRRARLAALATLALATGCSAPGPVFPPVDPPVLWPASGDSARFAYVGKIEGEADLKRPRSLWRRFVDFIGGPEPPAMIRSAFGVAVTPEWVLYVADPDAHLVHRFDIEGRGYEALKDAGDGRGFVTPIGLALSAGKLLVSDRALRTVTVLSLTGEPEAVLGAGLLEGPVGVAVGPSGRIYVADVAAHKIVCFDPDSRAALEFGGRGNGPGKLNYPTHVACDAAENIFVSDSLNSRVQVFDRNGRFLRAWGRRGDSPGDFSQPKGIACDAAGRVYVVDSHFENVQVFSPEGELLLAFGGEGNGPGELWLPVGVFVDARSHVWVGDSFHHCVQVFRHLEGVQGQVEP